MSSLQLATNPAAQPSVPQSNFFGANNAPNWVVSHVVVVNTGFSTGPPTNGAPPTTAQTTLNIVPLVTVLCSVGVLFLVGLIVALIILFRNNKDEEDEKEHSASQNWRTENNRYTGRQGQNAFTSIRITEKSSPSANSGTKSVPTDQSPRSIEPAVGDAPAVVRTLSNQSPTNHAEAPNALYTPYEAHPSKGNKQNQFEKWLASPVAAKAASLAQLEDGLGEQEVKVIVTEDQVEAQTLPDRPEASIVSRGLNKRMLNGVLV